MCSGRIGVWVVVADLLWMSGVMSEACLVYDLAEAMLTGRFLQIYPCKAKAIYQSCEHVESCHTWEPES